MVDFRTEERFSIVTSKLSTLYFAAILISFVATSIFFLIFVFFQIPISVQIIVFGIVIFIASAVSIALIRTEYTLAINNDYQRRPPIQFIIIFVVSYILLFISVPDGLFIIQPKSSPVIFTLLAIPTLAITFVLYRLYHTVFIWIVDIFAKISPKRILHNEQIVDKIDVKFNEVKRYGGTFSIILISMKIDPDKAERVKQTMIFLLFFNILKENIRRTDQLGIFENGSAACVLSNNNNYVKAELQAQRLIAELEKNALLKKKLTIFSSEYSHSIVEYAQTFEESKDMINKATEDMRKILTAKKAE
jgi:hypothetical protein